LSVDGPAEIDRLSSHLDTTYRMTAGRLPRNAGVRMENDELVLSALDKLEEPPSLIALRAAVTARLPRVDLPELLLEIHARTGLAGGFTHASEGSARAGDLATSLCAVLLAEACNTGFEPLIRLDNPALSRSRLSWVRQNYIRAETLSLSNATLVAAQNRIGLAKSWGGGDVASADGLRFVVPIRTLHAGPNPRYFGHERGVTFYNLVSDQFTGLNGITVPGTLRDSLSLLSVVLEQQTKLQPTEIMSDTGAYTDTIFGIFHLLGYQFSPRLADIGGTRFWRVDRTANYGALNILASHCIDTTLIATQWEDLLRLAGSLKLGTVQASGLIRTLQTRDRPTRLAQALEQLGRLVKTLYLLHFIDDEAYRRRILVQLNRGEGRHQLARVVFHGKRGELRQRYREGQEDQLGSLGLVVNAIILWNTIYMDAALNQLRAEGFDVRDEDVARLSPLGFDHINMLGRYAFTLPDIVARGQLRPLRHPANPTNENLVELSVPLIRDPRLHVATGSTQQRQRPGGRVARSCGVFTSRFRADRHPDQCCA
jgi:TnpA family transposase